MKFIVKKGTPLFLKLEKIIKDIQHCDKMATDYAKTLGSKDGSVMTYNSGNYRGGGIDAIGMDSKPEGWRDVKNARGFYYPKAIKENKTILDAISNLPKVTTNEFNDIIGFKFGMVGMSMYSSYALSKGSGYFLIDVPTGLKYKPVADMEEILDSVYQEYMEKINNKAKEKTK